MTFRVEFYADQAFFSMIKRILNNAQKYDEQEKIDFEAEESATIIIICHSACEAFLNLFARNIETISFVEYEKTSIIDKINVLYKKIETPPNWESLPLQDIRKIDKLRNWLTHFKNSNIGLVNSWGEWVVDDINKRPKIDDGEELKYSSVTRYYDNIRKSLFEITKLYNLQQDYEYLNTEEYTSYLVG